MYIISPCGQMSFNKNSTDVEELARVELELKWDVLEWELTSVL